MGKFKPNWRYKGRRWKIRYDRDTGHWVAWPTNWPDAVGAWTFNSWEDALEYANSNGRASHIERTSPTGL